MSVRDLLETFLTVKRNKQTNKSNQKTPNTRIHVYIREPPCALAVGPAQNHQPPCQNWKPPGGRRWGSGGRGRPSGARRGGAPSPPPAFSPSIPPSRLRAAGRGAASRLLGSEPSRRRGGLHLPLLPGGGAGGAAEAEAEALPAAGGNGGGGRARRRQQGLSGGGEALAPPPAAGRGVMQQRQQQQPGPPERAGRAAV